MPVTPEQADKGFNNERTQQVQQELKRVVPVIDGMLRRGNKHITEDDLDFTARGSIFSGYQGEPLLSIKELFEAIAVIYRRQGWEVNVQGGGREEITFKVPER